jgi:hypothetical protein
MKPVPEHGSKGAKGRTPGDGQEAHQTGREGSAIILAALFSSLFLALPICDGHEGKGPGRRCVVPGKNLECRARGFPVTEILIGRFNPSFASGNPRLSA